MTKRKQPSSAAAKRPSEAAAQATAAAAPPPEHDADEEQEQQPAKRRRAARLASQAATRARGRPSSAAAAAAAGRAESDDDASSSSGSSSDGEDSDGGGSGSESEDTGQSDGEGSQHERDDPGRIKTARGVQKWGNLFAVFVKLPQLGGAPPLRTRLGAWPTLEAAARVHDAALIAILGPKAAEPGLNFPLSQYRGARQLMGPQLSALLQQLSAEGGKQRRGSKPKGRTSGKAQAVTEEQRKALRERLRRMHEAVQAKAAQGLPRAKQAVEQARHADPLWVRSHARGGRGAAACGICPACRQPWRADLGACQRVAVAKAAGHDEGTIVGLLAADPSYRAAALDAFYERRRQEQQQQQQQQLLQQEQGQDPGRGRTGQVSPAPSSPSRSPGQSPRRQQQRRGEAGTGAGEELELEWLAPAPKATSAAAASKNQLVRMRTEAAAQLQQQQAWEQGRLEAALEREQQLGAPPAAGQAPSAPGGDGSPTAATAAEAAASKAAAAHPGLVDPGSWLTRARAPSNLLHQDGLAELLHLAALCRDGGTHAPLVPELAAEALGDAEQQLEAQQRLAEVIHRQQQAGSSEAGDAAEGAAAAAREELDAAVEAAAEAAVDAAASGRQSLRCQLCGGKHPGNQGLAACPVAQMALALPKPPQPECPGCAGRERPGCRQCQGGSAMAAAAAQPWTRRAPWLERVPPGTRDLMEAAQALASAAAADLDVPAVAWSLTPRALLAVGLMAEEAARLEVAARFPPSPQQAAGAGQQQQQATAPPD